MGKIICLNDREVELSFDELDNLPLEELLTINYSKISDDIATFPFIVNQINFLLVEANDILRKEEFQLDCLQANISEYKAKSFMTIKKKLVDEGEKNPTISLIESQICLKQEYKDLQEAFRCQKMKIAEATKNRDYLNGLYWSSKSKMEVLISLSKNISI
ncbi:hypothetical protein SJC03_250 [Bacteroides phage SJC03]|nr:hypothetical protein SJC03_250 [Bacteroides phage SJC03]